MKPERTKEEILNDAATRYAIDSAARTVSKVSFIAGAKWMEEYRQSSPVESKWVSVKERLPEPGIKVLVRILYGAGNSDLTMSYTTKRFPDCFDHLLNERITHWQPLPELPIEETKEK